MKSTIEQVLNFKSIYPTLSGQALSIKTTYKLSKLFAAVAQESEFYSTELNKLIDLYAQKDENGVPCKGDTEQSIRLEPSLIPQFQHEFEELIMLEVELPDVAFTLDELSDIKLSVEELNLLKPFIKE